MKSSQNISTEGVRPVQAGGREKERKTKREAIVVDYHRSIAWQRKSAANDDDDTDIETHQHEISGKHDVAMNMQSFRHSQCFARSSWPV